MRRKSLGKGIHALIRTNIPDPEENNDKEVESEDKIGLMLPCNVIVQDVGEGRTEVAAIDPLASMQAIENPDLVGVAGEVREKLKRVIENL